MRESALDDKGGYKRWEYWSMMRFGDYEMLHNLDKNQVNGLAPKADLMPLEDLRSPLKVAQEVSRVSE